MSADEQVQLWEAARLIPVSGIRGVEEQERRATSALLAVLQAVDEFGTSFSKQYGAPKCKVETFIEPRFELADGRNVRPDGLIRAKRGKKTWVALVEVKTQHNELDQAQVEDYLDVAKENEFDCVITISNQIVRIPGEHPVAVDKRKIRKIGLHHVSWSRILTDAITHKAHTGVADVDQAWILGELIRYLEHPATGALDFDDMGTEWVAVRDAAKAGTLRATDKAAGDVAGRWEELISYVVLRLGRELGAPVQEILSRKELDEPALRIANVIESMAEKGMLEGRIRIPNTVGDVTIRADLRAQQVVASVDLGAPQQGRPTTRLNWLFRQLKNAPADSRIDAFGVRSSTSRSELLADGRDKPDLLLPVDGRDLNKFTVSLARPMGLKRGTGAKSFIGTVVATLDEFYGSIVQHLSEWQPPAPKLNKQTESEASSSTSSVSADPDVAPRANGPDLDHQREGHGSRPVADGPRKPADQSIEE